MKFENFRFYKYLNIGEEEKKWGIYLTGAGHIHVDKHTEYPLVDDPSHHYFHWSTGRRLNDYQVLYITKGRGVFETEATGLKPITAGDIFILFPGTWHRFTPDRATGWDEYWVEFNGDLINHYRNNDYLNPSNPVMKVGVHVDIAENYLKIINLIKDERPGFQYIAAGILVEILGQILAAKKYNLFQGKNIETQIIQAKLILLENISTPISQVEIARNVGMGYSIYRKKFKEYTGVSPARYHINLRINNAKMLLITTNLSLKEVALKLGFESTDYFYRLFKQRTGMTPSDFREKNEK